MQELETTEIEIEQNDIYLSFEKYDLHGKTFYNVTSISKSIIDTYIPFKVYGAENVENKIVKIKNPFIK